MICSVLNDTCDLTGWRAHLCAAGCYLSLVVLIVCASVLVALAALYFGVTLIGALQ